MMQDVTLAIRTLTNSPGFAAAVILTLALGMGVNSTVFTLVNGVLLKGLPFENPDEIVSLGSVTASANPRPPASYQDFLDFKYETRALKALGAFSNIAVDLSDPESAAERVAGALITANTFSLLGRSPILGRDFSEDDERPGAERVAMLSYGVWQSRYGGDPGIIGRTIRVNQNTHTVVGIMPVGEGFPNGTGVWLPLIPDATRARRDQRNIEVFGRLASGVSLNQARAEMSTIARRLAQAYPATNKDVGVRVVPYTDREAGGPIRTVFIAMQGAVGFVLLIACANVANLLLSRCLRRLRETSIRTSLGAGRWRIVRQLLVESLVLSLVGGALGLAMAVGGVRLFWNAVKDTGPPYWLNFSMDHRVFAFFFLVSVGTGILFGLAPALQISKANINDYLRDGGRGVSGGVRSRRLASTLLVAQMTLTIVLLVGAGLMIRSFLNLQRVDIGVPTSGLLTASITMRNAKYSQAEDRFAFQERLMETLRAMPGLENVTLASHGPAAGAMNGPFKIADRDVTDTNGRAPQVYGLAIAPGYFRALSLKMTQGREFTAADGKPGNHAVIVNEMFAAKYWLGESPLGKRIAIGAGPDAPWTEVVGVSPPVYQSGPPSMNDLTVQPTVYVPYRQDPTPNITILVRSRLATEALTASLRTELRNIDADMPLFNIRTLADAMWQRTWPNRVFGALFTIFAVIALVMASVGVYGVTAYGVGQRTQEIGIRMALGATDRDVIWLVLRQGIIRVVIGLMAGIPAAWGLSRVLRSLLYQVDAADPLTFIAMFVLMTAVMIAACLIPATRASRCNPLDALRLD